MNIIEAITSGKPFKRKYWPKFYPPGYLKNDNLYQIHKDDLLADDWEIAKEIKITREQFDQAYVRAVGNLPSNSTTKVLIDMIAEELGL